MSRKIQISDDTFKKMQKVAVPLEDSADSLLKRVLDFYISNYDSDSINMNPQSEQMTLMMSPYAPDDLTHSKIRWGKFADRKVSGRNWSQLVETAHEFVVDQTESFEEVQEISPFNVKEGKYEQRGYHFFSTAGVSVQYKSVPDVWDGCLKIAEHLNVPIEVKIEWLEKEDASHPGEKGILSWSPQKESKVTSA